MPDAQIEFLAEAIRPLISPTNTPSETEDRWVEDFAITLWVEGRESATWVQIVEGLARFSLLESVHRSQQSLLNLATALELPDLDPLEEAAGAHATMDVVALTPSQLGEWLDAVFSQLDGAPASYRPSWRYEHLDRDPFDDEEEGDTRSGSPAPNAGSAEDDDE